MKNNINKKSSDPARHKLLTRLGELISDGLITLVKWNILFILTSLPIITIGPSLCALHCCTNALVKDDLPQEKAAKLYFSAFRSCFLRMFPFGLLILLVNLIFGCGLFFYLSMTADSIAYIPFTSISALVLFFFWCILIHFLPSVFNMEKTDWDTKKVYASGLTLRELWHDAVSMAANSMSRTLAAMIFSIIFLGGQLMMFPSVLPLTLAIGFSFPAAAAALAHTEPDI